MRLRATALALLLALAACATGSDDAKRFSGIYGGVSAGTARGVP